MGSSCLLFFAWEYNEETVELKQELLRNGLVSGKCNDVFKPLLFCNQTLGSSCKLFLAIFSRIQLLHHLLTFFSQGRQAKNFPEDFIKAEVPNLLAIWRQICREGVEPWAPNHLQQQSSAVTAMVFRMARDQCRDIKKKQHE